MGGAALVPVQSRDLSDPSFAQAKDEDAAPLTDVEWLLVVAGNSDEENPYRKGSALQVGVADLRQGATADFCERSQTHLLGYEFPSTLMLLGKRSVYFVVSGSKGASRRYSLP